MKSFRFEVAPKAIFTSFLWLLPSGITFPRYVFVTIHSLACSRPFRFPFARGKLSTVRSTGVCSSTLLNRAITHVHVCAYHSPLRGFLGVGRCEKRSLLNDSVAFSYPEFHTHTHTQRATRQAVHNEMDSDQMLFIICVYSARLYDPFCREVQKTGLKDEGSLNYFPLLYRDAWGTVGKTAVDDVGGDTHLI